MTAHRFTLFADYHQFYVQDEAISGDLSDAWGPDATRRLLAVAPGVVGVGTVRNRDVPVMVRIEDRAPGLDLKQWDHVVECDLTVSGPRLVVAGCTDYFPDAARIAIAPAHYRVRVCMAGLQTVDDLGIEGSDEYHLLLWPAAPGGVRVLKQFVSDRRGAV